MKYNKVRGILRARQGSQIPKFLNPSGSLPPNPYMIASPVPTSIEWKAELPKTAEELYKEQLYTKTFNDTLGDKAKFNYFSDPLKTTSVLNNSNLGLKDKLGNFGKKIGNFANANQGAITSGINMVSDKLFGGTEDSGEFGAVTGAIGMLLNVPGPVGWYATAANTVLKGINKLGASTVEDTYINQDFANKAGGSYAGTMALGEKAMSNNGKEFGLFNRGGYRSAKRTRNKFLKLQDIATGIVNEASDLRAMVNDLNYLGYQMLTNGGFDLLNMGIRAKQGGTLDTKINLVKSRKFNLIINTDTKLVEEFKLGGNLPEIEWKPIIEDVWEPIIEIPGFLEGGKVRTLEELIKYAKELNPRFIQRLSEESRGIKFIDDEGNDAEGSHYLEYSEDGDEAIVYPRIQEIDGKLKHFLNWKEALDNAYKNNNILKMSKDEAKIFSEGYKQGWPKFFESFKTGGKTKEELETPEIEETNQKNLIPEGALHKNKHHMEHTEGLTLKGIPVIDNSGEQLAEIEHSEIIFTLEVTKKLEELYKDGSDEAAIEAGKLLVKEILFNTDDRTSLIDKIEI